METFLSGFAKGYINERERRLDEQNRKDEIKFKYKMDTLVSQRELRTKKKQEEEEAYNQAKALASQMGDPNAVGTFFNEIAIQKISPETLQKRIADGAYQKNENYTQPTQTIKVPVGVQNYDIPGTDGEDWAGINADIDAIDPTLRVGDDGSSSVRGDNVGNSYLVYKPKDEVKFAGFAEADYAYKVALDSGDPVAIRKTKLALDSHKDIETFKAQQKAKQEGKSGQVYGVVDAKGNLIGAPFVGEVDTTEGTMYNTSDPRGKTIVPIAQDQRVVAISEDQNKRRYEILQRKREDVEKYKASVGSYGAAINTQLQLEKLVQEHPNVTYAVTDLAVLAKSVQGNARAAMDLLVKQDAAVQAAFQSGDSDAIENAVSRFQTTMEDGILSQGVVDEAVAKARYNSLLTNAVYQFAAANGINGRDMSDKDVAAFKRMISEGGSDAILQNLDSINQSVLLKIMSTEKGFGKDPALQALMGEIGVTGMDSISLPRVGDMLDEVNPSGTLRMKHDLIRRNIEQGTLTATISAEQDRLNKETPEAQAQRENVRVKGEVYPTASGKKYRYLGGPANDPKSYEEVK
ncbi:hypothetical protein SmphiM6_28 [Sinorhizobium phage phiM6]|nr:hypothetical protein SmphiM6_28 [Sinorhizobium phage phiM6]